MKTEQAIENLINGNIADAKKLARRCSFPALFWTAREFGMSEKRAALAVTFLKKGTGWQQYCDAP